MEAKLSPYDTVLHLRTPGAQQGYNHQNPLRIESAASAAQVDARILEAWHQHPQRHIIESTGDFVEATHTLDLLREQLPTCCAGHLRSSAPASRPVTSDGPPANPPTADLSDHREGFFSEPS